MVFLVQLDLAFRLETSLSQLIIAKKPKKSYLQAAPKSPCLTYDPHPFIIPCLVTKGLHQGGLSSLTDTGCSIRQYRQALLPFHALSSFPLPYLASAAGETLFQIAHYNTSPRPKTSQLSTLPSLRTSTLASSSSSSSSSQFATLLSSPSFFIHNGVPN
ncbi:hypothetical protein EYC80_006166 [Monilinia laxa]|uniref:Uncharacterized protein n=1 Tax=Monilinia laxa TaxID=61186 RepID=A0A5N6KGK0_MONLA|nr:hypothetical protein EYC80_006166 [Monilinia laxa]